MKLYNAAYCAFLIALSLSVQGCETYDGVFSSSQPALRSSQILVPVTKPAVDFYKIKEPIQCVPYAREKSGIQIFGNAHTWWSQAKAKGYQTTSRPEVGSIMVLSKAGKLKYGHLAVVTNIIDRRTIEVTHSNWGNSFETRRVIYNRMRVKDSSSNGDWSRARFWHYASGSFGSSYAVSGFIQPNTSAQHLSMLDIK